jgi:hypothetical protein
MKMKRSSLFCLGFFLAILLFIGQLQAQEGKKQITISGTVDAVEFDDDENVTQIAISVEKQLGENDIDFIYYYIVNDKKGKELFRLIGKTVQVTGQLAVAKDKKNYITVTGYTLVTEEEQVDFDTFDDGNE